MNTELVDSHCHLHTLDLSEFDNSIDTVILKAQENGVNHLLCVCIELNELPALHALADKFSHISTSVGVHPNVEMEKEPSAKDLMHLSQHPSCIAIGETGLDYYRTTEEPAKESQRKRFAAHIQAALETGKPLIVHTREAAEDTLALMKAEKAADASGVMHCFAETWEVAKQALDLNFYISFSGIVTFKNALQLQEVAKRVPFDRILIETDSPYLAPVPFRGKQNHPALVKYVAQAIADLRGIEYEKVSNQTTENFYRLFKL